MKRVLLTLALLGGAAHAQTAPRPTSPAPTAPTPTTAPTAPAPTAPAQATPAPTSGIVATVGKESLTLADFEVAFRLAVAGVLNDQGLPYDPAMLSEFAGARPEYLKVFVRTRGLEQLARASAKPDSAKIDTRMTEIRARFKDEAAYKAALASAGYLDPAELRAELERQDVTSSYLSAIQKRSVFGDSVVNSFYTLHRAEFQQDKQACARHILIKTRAEADAIAAELKGGADFAAIARSKSLDPGSAAQGGDLGCFNPGQMVESFDRASFTGPLNQAQTVQSEFGWHVLLVTKRSEGGLLPLAEAAPLIREKLARDAAQKFVDSQLARLNPRSFPEVVTVPAMK